MLLRSQYIPLYLNYTYTSCCVSRMMAKRDVCLCVVRSNVMCVCVWSIASGVHSKTTACVSQVGWWLGAVLCLKFWCIVQWTGETAAWRRRRQRSRHRLDRRQLFIVNIITTTTTTTSHSSSSSTSPPQPRSCITTTTTTSHSSSSSTSPPQPPSLAILLRYAYFLDRQH